MKNLAVLLLVLYYHSLGGQSQDQIWLFGFASGDQVDSMLLADTTWGATNFDFSFDPPFIYYDQSRIWDFGGTNSSMCDENGELLFYTNGQAVYSGDHKIIEDTINYNLQWDNWSFTQDGVLINTGLPSIQGALSIPFPDHDDKFYIFYQQYSLLEEFTSGIYYSTLEIGENGDSHILERDIPLLLDTLGSGSLTATKHANGRDWWLVFSGAQNNKFFKFLIDPLSIHNKGEQLIGNPNRHVLGQMYFSPNGEFLAINSGSSIGIEGTNFSVMRFNRCNGVLSNRLSESLSNLGVSSGVSFSSNNRFVYVSTDSHLFQYDLNSLNPIEDKKLVAEYDGYEYFYPEDVDSLLGFATTLGWMSLAPDHKIYISSGSGGNRKMHIIHSPDLLAPNCNLGQHEIHLPTSYRRTMPNFPNFRLGPLDGSECDTLNIDNNPVAQFRCEQDSLNPYSFNFIDLSYFNPTTWIWEFGSNGTSDEQFPHFTFQEKGVYEVCLTVSNEYSENKFCKTIEIGTTSTNQLQVNHRINLFPNPAIDDLSITFHDYFPISSSLKIYSLQGVLVYSGELNSNINKINISKFSSGLYICKIVDGKKLVGTKTFIKI